MFIPVGLKLEAFVPVNVNYWNRAGEIRKRGENRLLAAPG